MSSQIKANQSQSVQTKSNQSESSRSASTFLFSNEEKPDRTNQHNNRDQMRMTAVQGQVKSKQSSPNQCKPNQSNPNQVAPLQAKSKSTPVQINSTDFSSVLSPSPRAKRLFQRRQIRQHQPAQQQRPNDNDSVQGQSKSKQSSPNQCKPNQSNPNQIAPLQAKSKSTPVQINSTDFSFMSPSSCAEPLFLPKK